MTKIVAIKPTKELYQLYTSISIGLIPVYKNVYERKIIFKKKIK